MNENTLQNLFKGDRTLISAVDVDAPLATAETPCCEYYMDAYGSAAQQAEKQGDANAANVYRFLQAVTSFHQSFDTPAEPFVPYFRGWGRRGFVPSDLTPDDIEAVRELSKTTKDPALRARLFDVLWELTNEHKMCGEAGASYIDEAERLNTPDHWTFSVNGYHRGLYLAAKLGRDKELFRKAAESLQEAVRNLALDAGGFRCCQFLELLVRFACGDPAELAAIAAGHAQKASDAGNPYAARPYRKAEADLHKLGKNAAGEKAARLAAAEASVTEAENRAHGADASFLAGAALLSKAIEALRQAGATKERVEELRRKLTDWQGKSLAEFKTFSAETDISKLVITAQEHVRGKSFQDAVMRLAFGQVLADPKTLKDQVRENAKQAPLTHIMGAALVDSRGRTSARKEGLLNLTGEALEEALEAEAFSHASRFYWPLRVDSFIEPARVQIFNDHKPTFRDLLFIVQNNPFIPPGHETIFLRGLHAGFHGDFLVASHLLTPQIENSLRYVLESHGVDVSNLMSDGTQPVKILGAIFGILQTKQIIGESLCFELRGCLIEKTGYDFRNRLAHGFANEAECYSAPGVTVWWLVLRICLTPFVQSVRENQKGSDGQPSAPKTTSGQA